MLMAESKKKQVIYPFHWSVRHRPVVVLTGNGNGSSASIARAAFYFEIAIKRFYTVDDIGNADAFSFAIYFKSFSIIGNNNGKCMM